VRNARVTILALFTVLGLGGCFDVNATNLLVIDNFNDGDLQPLDPGFGSWQAYGINSPEDPAPKCVLDPDTQDRSPAALLLPFTVTDPVDLLQEDGGAGVKTGATMGAVDFTAYGRIAFDIKLVSGGDNPLPSNALVYLELGCSSVPAESGDLATLYVVQGVPYTSDWQYVPLTLVNFGPPPWLTTPIKGGTVACLQHVDSVRFSIDAKLPDGKIGMGALHLDNVVLE